MASDGTYAKASYEEEKMESCTDITMIKTRVTENPKPDFKNKRAF